MSTPIHTNGKHVAPAARKLFSVIYADPPWDYTSNGRAIPMRYDDYRSMANGAVQDTVKLYGSMTVGELRSLRAGALAEKNAHLYMWVTNSFMVEGHSIAKAWGFEVKTILTWNKMAKDVDRASPGTGYYYRGSTEHLLFGVRGSLKLRGPVRPTSYSSLRLPHSVKPDFFRKIIEEQSPGPYLELFGRKMVQGWTVIGNEVTGNDIRVDLEKLRNASSSSS